MNCDNCKNFSRCRFKDEGRTKEHCNYYLPIDKHPEPPSVSDTKCQDIKYAKILHYPGCWDTAAYPTLSDAIWESLSWAGCSECNETTTTSIPVAELQALRDKIKELEGDKERLVILAEKIFRFLRESATMGRVAYLAIRDNIYIELREAIDKARK